MIGKLSRFRKCKKPIPEVDMLIFDERILRQKVPKRVNLDENNQFSFFHKFPKNIFYQKTLTEVDTLDPQSLINSEKVQKYGIIYKIMYSN